MPQLAALCPQRYFDPLALICLIRSHAACVSARWIHKRIDPSKGWSSSGIPVRIQLHLFLDPRIGVFDSPSSVEPRVRQPSE